jgi:serine/threonine-protein kinase
MRALDASPKDRYPSASAMLADLRALRDGLRIGQPTLAPEPAEEQREVAPAVEQDSLSRGYWWLLALFVLTVMVFFGVTLLVARQRAEIQVPQFVGKTWDEAQSEAESRGIELIDDGRVFSESYQAGKICSAVPPVGSMVPRNSAVVKVKISSGPSTVEVPDLVGMTEADASDAARNAGFAIGKVKQEYSDKVQINSVIAQDPEGGLRRTPGMAIDLVMSQGLKPAPEEQPEEPTTGGEGGERKFTVNVEVPAGSDGPQDVLIKVIDDRGETTAYEQTHEPGDKFSTSVTAEGSNIRIKVYVGGTLVKDVPYK